MAAKNNIKVKKAFEKNLLIAADAAGIKLKKTRVKSETHVFYNVELTHFQTLFELGYVFATINRKNK